MTQSVWKILTALICALASALHIGVAVPMPKEPLPHEQAPVHGEYRFADAVHGVDDSVFYIDRPNPERLQTVYASAFGLQSAAWDNHDAMQAAMDYCRAHPNTCLVIEPGTYHFRSAQNLRLSGSDTTRIEAAGAEFIFSENGYFDLSDSDCIEICGLTVDWDWDTFPLASLVYVQNRDTKKNTLELVFAPGQTVSEDLPLCALTQYDPVDKTPGALNASKESYMYQRPGSIRAVEKIADNVLKITHDGSLRFAADGELYLLRHEVYGGCVFNVRGGCKNITFDGVRIYAGKGMGFIFSDGCERFQILNTYIGLNPATADRHRISMTADAVHIANTNGHFRISGCDFSFMGDDCVNVHDNIAMVDTILSDTRLSFKTNAYILREGERVVFCTDTYQKLDFTATVVRRGENEIELDRAIPDTVTPGSILYSADCDSGNYVICDNYFHENRARALLLQSDNGLCENNLFYKTMGEAVKIIMDIQPGLWYEGSGVNNLVVRNNVFRKCNYSGWESVIVIGSNLAGHPASTPIFFNIVLQDNLFDETTRTVICADDSCVGLQIVGNRICNRENLGGVRAERGRISIGRTCKAVTIEGNVWQSSVYAPFASLIAYHK